eukprot:417213-Prymnesium_polylepis.2
MSPLFATSLAFQPAPHVPSLAVTTRHPIVLGVAHAPVAKRDASLVSKLQAAMPWQRRSTRVVIDEEEFAATEALQLEEAARAQAAIRKAAKNDAVLAAAALTGLATLGVDFAAVDLATQAEVAMAAAVAAGYGATQHGPVGETLTFAGNVTKELIQAAKEVNEKHELTLKARAVVELGVERAVENVATAVRSRQAAREVATEPLADPGPPAVPNRPGLRKRMRLPTVLVLMLAAVQPSSAGCS